MDSARGSRRVTFAIRRERDQRIRRLLHELVRQDGRRCRACHDSSIVRPSTLIVGSPRNVLMDRAQASPVSP